MNKRRGTGTNSNYLYSALSVIAIATAGCAGQTPAAHDARAAGEWSFRLPETGSPYAGLAISDRGYQQNGLTAVDDALATQAAKVQTPAPKARPVTQRSVVAKTEKVAPQPAAAPAPASTPVVATTTQPEQLALATPVTDARDETRYSQREQKSQQQRDFRGGDAIVISASALVIILLVVILILLLT